MAKKIQKEQLEKRVNIIKAIIKFSLLLVIIVGIPVYIFLCHRDILTEFNSIDDIENFLSQYHTVGIFIYLASQVLQIIISIIPGQELQIVAGFMYGIFFAYVLSIIGAAIGTTITYFLGKYLGRDAAGLLFGKEKTEKYVQRLNSKKAVAIVFLIYLIPGLPKDIMSYIAGISNIKIKPFIGISLVGRTPGMLASIIIGKQLVDGDYHSIIIIAAIVVVGFILGVIFRNKLLNMFDRYYDRRWKEDEKV